MAKAQSPELLADVDGQFIFYWIAFNSLYGVPRYLPTVAGNEEDDMEAFLSMVKRLDSCDLIGCKLDKLKHDVSELTKDIFLSKQCWIEWHKRGIDSVDDRLKNAFFAKRRNDGLVGLFQSIYVLRNQIFHGSSTDKGSKNREMLKRGVRVLEKLVPVFQNIVAEHVNDPKLIKLLGELPYPPSVGGIG